MRSEAPSEKRGVLCLVAYFVRLVRRERWKEKQCIRKAEPQSTSQVRGGVACRRWETWPGVSRPHLSAEEAAESQRYWRVRSLGAPAAIRRLGRGLEHVPAPEMAKSDASQLGRDCRRKLEPLDASRWSGSQDAPKNSASPPARPVLSEATSGRSASPKGSKCFLPGSRLVHLEADHREKSAWTR